MDSGTKTALQWQLTKYVRNLMASMFSDQISNNNPQFPMDGGQLEVITGLTLTEDGMAVTTDQSTYLIEVKKVGDV